ncbi:MAG: type II secretion system F family protein, partial [Coriobacteriales bacterium]|nr:type II secretion system F family protein [Coriobacteriales bacterium]
MAFVTDRRMEMAPAELSLFFSNLEIIYHSGLTLAEGIDVLRQGAHTTASKAWFERLYESSVGGAPLTETLEAAGGIPDYALSLLRVGEESGRLEDACHNLREYYDKRDELSQALRSALVYPSAMVLMVFVVIVILLTQAMPIFDQVFNQLGFGLTGFAGSLLAVGQALRSSALYLSAALAVLVIAILVLRALPAGKRALNSLYEKAPITRDLSFRLAVQRFSFAMSVMLKSGIPSDAALALAQPLLNNLRATEKVQALHKEVEGGKSLQAA